MKDEKLFEDIFSYSDHDGLLENELASPLEESGNRKRRGKTLFERLLSIREAEGIGPVGKIGNTQNPPPYPDPKNKQRSPNQRRPHLTPEEEKEADEIKSDPGEKTFKDLLNDLKNQSQ